MSKKSVLNNGAYPDTFTGKLNQCFLNQIQQLHDVGMPYHIADERTLETHAIRDLKGLRTGNCLCKNMLVAEGAKLNEPGRRLAGQLETQLASGGDLYLARGQKYHRRNHGG